MHIGFDISQTGNGKAGCGFFAHAMIKAMLELAPQHLFSLHPSFGDFYFDVQMPHQNPYMGQDMHYGPLHNSQQEASDFWLNPNLEEALGRPDIVHANNFWCPPQLTSSRLIYTFYDMNFVVEPSWTTELNRVACFEGVFRSSMVADWVIAISEASRTHYLKLFPHFPADRIRVIYPSSRFINLSALGARPKSLGNLSSQGFWLSVGTIEPRKNQRRLVEAYANYLKLGGATLPLVLAGGNGWLMDDFKAYITELGLDEHIIMTGYATDEELFWLYRNCYAHVYPSLFEGFGLPVLEGMQMGAPTITSNTSSIPEVAGDAAILIDPEDVNAITQALLRLSNNREERDQLSDAGLTQSAKFDWQQSAASLLSLYKQALSTPKRK